MEATKEEETAEAVTRRYVLVLVCTQEGLMLPVDDENMISVLNGMISTQVEVEARDHSEKIVRELRHLVNDLSLTNVEYPLSFEPTAYAQDRKPPATGMNFFVTLFVKSLPEDSREFVLVPYETLDNDQRLDGITTEVLRALSESIAKARSDFFAPANEAPSQPIAAPAPVPAPVPAAVVATPKKEMKMTRPTAEMSERTHVPNTFLESGLELTVVIPMCDKQRMAGSASVRGHWTAFHERLCMTPFSKFPETDALRLAKKIPSFTGELEEIGALDITDGKREIKVHVYVAKITSTSQAQINTHLRSISQGELTEEAHRYDLFSLDLYAKLDGLALAAPEQKAS